MNNTVHRTTFAAVCKLVTDGTHDSPKLIETGVPLIKGKHISGGRIDFASCDYISHEDHLAVIARSKPERGDTLFSNIGSVGDAAFVDTDQEFSIKNVALFKPDSSKINPKYLFYLLRSDAVRSEILAARSGSAQPFISLGALRSHPVSVHSSVETQRRIASILGAYDDLIEVNRRRIEVLEEMARGLFEEWFVRFRFPGHENVSILDTPGGPMPEGWRQATVSEAFELLRGRSYRSAELADQGGMPFVNLKCMDRDGGFRISGLKRFTGDFKPNHAVVRGDIVLAVTDMTQERRIIGRAARIPLLDEPEAVISMDLVKVRPRESIDRSFLYCWLRYSDFGLKAAQHANGANVLHLSPKAIVDLPFILPPPNSQLEFGRTVEAFFAQTEVLAVAERRLSASRDLLLPRLISGQLSVAEAEQQLEEVA